MEIKSGDITRITKKVFSETPQGDLCQNVVVYGVIVTFCRSQ